MKRIVLLLVGVCALGGAVFTTGCGPGLVAAGGGSVGAIFGLQGSDSKKKSNPPPTSTNVVPAVIVTSVVREESPATVTYTILDANDDVCSVEVEYAIGAGTFSTCFEGSGGDGLTGLSSNAGGVAHTFAWDFATDLGGPGLTQNITVRIRANDGTATGSWSSLTGQDIGNDAPVVSNIQANGVDVVLLTFDLTDQSSDLGSLDVSFSSDQGQNFTPIDINPASGTYELIGNAPVNLLTSPSGSPGQFVWDSKVALNDFVGNVLIKLEPKDQPSGYSGATSGAPVVAGPFPIDTSVNGPPEISLLTNFAGFTYTSTVPFDVTLQDDESNAAVVVVEYSISGGAFQPCTLVNQFASSVAGPFPTSPSPTGYTIVWDALADLGSPALFSNIVLQMTPGDATFGTSVSSDPFNLQGNEAPEVTDIQSLQTSGNIPIVITVEDGQSDPVSLNLEYSTDGTNYTALSASDFVFGNPDSVLSAPTGEANVLIWDSYVTFPNLNAASVTLRATPTDHPASATPAADLTGASFISQAFPIINDPSGAAPISIDIFTDDNGAPPNPTDDVTVVGSGQIYLDRVVNPASATVTNTFWKIFETGADYGQLLTPAGASLQYSQGSVTVNAPGGGGTADGDTFVIDDGINGPQTFEFDSNGSIQVGAISVDIAGATTQNEIGVALTAAINANPSVRIFATYAGSGVIQLKHEIACNIGDAASLAAGGNAADMAFSTGATTAGVVGAQMNGGSGSQRVQYVAPATPPAGSFFVTIVCEIDDPAYFTTVFSTYRIWWGTKPTGVTVNPSTTSVLVNGTNSFTAEVANVATAPQFVGWVVVGGNVNGTISDQGLYTAPSSVPTTNPVEIRAYCVDPSVAPGTASITIQPEPTNVQVTPPADNPPSWVKPDLALGATIGFTSSVVPTTAPQGVTWRVVWNSQDWGSGNSTVGTVDSSGNYTAPSTLPSPDTVRVDAVSTAKPSVFGSFFVDLVAPAPTSFSVSPATASVFAGGAGKQFTATNFVPTNANQAVTWEINPVVGTISTTGFYTPPNTSAAAQSITVTARSAVNTSITATASLTVQPAVQTSPLSVTISPDEGVTISQVSKSVPIQFSAVVAPAQASQAVTWSFVGAAFGNLDANTGLYTPAPSAVDRIVRIRAEANASPNPFDEVDIYIAGDGQNWLELENITMGRGDTSAVWDPVNQRVWFVGGHSETATNVHDDQPLYLETIAGSSTFGAYQPVKGAGTFPKAANCIMCVCDEINDRLLAVIGQGLANTVLIYSLDLNNVTGGTPAAWTQVTAGNLSDAPKLAGNVRYHCWYDIAHEEIQILRDRFQIFRYDTDKDEWKTVKTTQDPSNAPNDVQLVSHAFDDNNQIHYFVGADNGTGSSSNKVWELRESDWKWRNVTSSGNQPAGGLRNASSYFDNGKIWVFGGQVANQSTYSNDLYSISLGTGAAWTKHNPASERPLPRGDAGFILTGLGDAFLYGGEIEGIGTFGDLWYFDDTTTEFIPENADNIRAQGRRSACGVWEFGEAIIYGGLCDHGPSNELWTFDYNGGNPIWERQAAGGQLPPPMWGSAMALDDLHAVNVMFGGDKAPPGTSGGLENRVWYFDTSNDTWTEMSVSGSPPSPRREAALCWDDDNRRIWMFGGVDSSGFKNDLWYLDLTGGLASASWHLVTATSGSAPDSRAGATIGYDSRKSRVLVCGGESSVSGANRQLYSYTLGSASWAALSVANPGQEEDVFESSAIYDDEYSRILHAPATRPKAQALVMGTNGPVWQYMAPPGSNNAKGTTGLYDRSTGRYYSLFGEKTILSRSVGTNLFRTFVVK
ncbi:MAG: hypothetical protein R3E76_07495 [Planctomycetota bacterium]